MSASSFEITRSSLRLDGNKVLSSAKLHDCESSNSRGPLPNPCGTPDLISSQEL